MIFFQLKERLQSLDQLLDILNDQQYVQQIDHLGKSSIGGHTRHIIELIQCATNGYHAGNIDYINRSRNMQLESDRHFAKVLLKNIENNIELADKQLQLATEETGAESTALPIYTTYFREIVYNTEHTIHHLALIKVALIEMKLDVTPESFGVATSTLKFKASNPIHETT